MPASPLRTFGCMLCPCAKKRTCKPRCSTSSHSIANCAVSRRDNFADIFTEQGLHGRRIRDKRKVGARHTICNLTEKFQNESDRIRRVMRHETAREQFRGRCGAAERPYFVLLAVRQHENSIEWRAIGFSNPRVAVPRSPVHPYAAGFGAQDNASVAEHARAGVTLPQRRRRTLSRAGVAREQQPGPVWRDHAAAVYFDA